jgi:hypothetical protein
VADLSRDFNYQVSGSSDADPFSEAIAEAKSRNTASTALWLTVSAVIALMLAVAAFVFIKKSRRISRRAA